MSPIRTPVAARLHPVTSTSVASLNLVTERVGSVVTTYSDEDMTGSAQ
jgi:hypothetical protein